MASSSRSTMDAFVLTDEWVVVRELGRGGFATVVEVHRIGDQGGRHLACKIIEIEPMLTMFGLDYEGIRARVSFLTRNLDAPYVIKSFSFRMNASHIFIFSEMYSGGDLYSRVVDSPDGRLTEDQALRVARRLLHALRFIHNLGIIHRDIKPENIYFRDKAAFLTLEKEDFVLGDFGCAIIDVTEDQLFVGPAGSPGYIAPEAVSGQPYDMKVDNFSVGICVYEMLTGRSPFLSTESEDLLKEVIERDIPFPRRYWGCISPEAKDFVQRATKRDPRDRWSVDQLLEHPWMRGQELTSTAHQSLSASASPPLAHPHLSDRGTLDPLISDPIAVLCKSYHSDGDISRLAADFEGQALLQPRRTTRIVSKGVVRLSSVTSSISSVSIPAVAVVDVP